MRGVETRIQEIRHRIFREVARMAYHTEWPIDKRIEELPYKIIPGEVGNFRNDVFLERAIVGERLRLAMGLPNRSAAEHAPLSDNIEAADKPETYYTPPLINVIKFACNGCPEKRVYVTEGCQGCLAHPCEEVCPKDAVKLDHTTGRSHMIRINVLSADAVRMSALIMRSSSRSVHVQLPVVWMQFIPMRMEKQISIMRSAYPVASVW